MKAQNDFHLVMIAAVLVGTLAGSAKAENQERYSELPWTDKKQPYGIEQRTLWTTSHVVGTPEPPPPFTTERIFPHLHFDRSLDLVNSPDGRRWFISEDPGLIYSFPKDQNVERADVFLDIRSKDYRYLAWNEGRRIWSIAFHPKYQSNGYVYVCYLESKPKPNRCRISRFTVDVKNPGNYPTADGDSEYILLEWVTAVDHFGGCLRFGPDGYLYFTAGDGGPSGDTFNTGQDISDLNAAVMRIDVDKNVGGKVYGIPADNPFVNTPGARGEVWAYGTRNIWKMSFDKKTGDLWGGDVGQDLWDMVEKIVKGGNYGWSITEGTHAFIPARKLGPTPILPPAVEHDHAEVRSVTGGYVYRGTRLPDLTGMYIYGDFETGKMYAYKDDGKYPGKPLLIAETSIKIVGFGEDNDGELVILDYMGTMHRLIPTPKAENVAPFPKKLSETGIFSSVKDHKMAPGVIPYAVNSPLWSDNAVKDRYLAIPGKGKIDYSANDPWRFPEGSVLVKTFGMEMKAGDPSSVKRLETRLLHFEKNLWHYYTYVWNDDQSDAELLGKDSLDRELEISDAAAPGGKRKQTWHFPSRSECTLCHTFIAGYALGTNTAQFNRIFNYGTSDNQLRTLSHIGLFSQPLNDHYRPGPSEKPTDPKPTALRLADPHDVKESLDDRARGYLQANCAHCHRMYGGGNSLFYLQASLPLEKLNAVNAVPSHGNYDLPDARVIAPGAPERSMILHRMTRMGEGRMPRLASSVIDTEAVKLISEWISKLK